MYSIIQGQGIDIKHEYMKKGGIYGDTITTINIYIYISRLTQGY